ncbi:hypothetical protein C3F09_01160 [candidate division GN15 bacterium]|uniref:Uncharacterized protein n=1 Tax=candidate division GN15 bacterium TaxID=2072418 RepID=A0A855XCP1_9BACT|nr:MAG: hypothetical protein C3F09_01160 [candidate division GN15 bacterium]
MLERYAYLDQSYNQLLRLYFENPQFGDREKTDDYLNQFEGEELLRYHFFAMMVHTVMETIFDVSKGRIPLEWIQIFNHHSRLHVAWLEHNRGLQEEGYLATVLGFSNA